MTLGAEPGPDPVRSGSPLPGTYTRARWTEDVLDLYTNKSATMICETVVKRRAAVERWKEKNRSYYLQQKRTLASRPESLARRREIYRDRREAFIAEHGLPRRGRPPRSLDSQTKTCLEKYIHDFEKSNNETGN